MAVAGLALEIAEQPRPLLLVQPLDGRAGREGVGRPCAQRVASIAHTTPPARARLKRNCNPGMADEPRRRDQRPEKPTFDPARVAAVLRRSRAPGSVRPPVRHGTGVRDAWQIILQPTCQHCSAAYK